MTKDSGRDRIVGADDSSITPDHTPLVRPTTLAELDVGQDWIQPLRIYVEASRQRREVLPHLLLVGPLGVGKSTLAHILANEMGSVVRRTSGRALQDREDLVGILSNLEQGDIFLIDELDRMPYDILEYLLPAINNFCVDFVVDRGPYAKTIRLDLKRFTLIGEEETTRELEPKLLSAFWKTIEIRPPTPEQLLRILTRFAMIRELQIEEDVVSIIAEAVGPSIPDAQRVLSEAGMYAQVMGEGRITAEHAREALGLSPKAGGAEASSAPATLLPGEGLEQVVSKALQYRGFNVQNVRHSKDGGVDILAVSDDPITGGRYIIQCKDWTHNIGVATVRELLGTVVREDAVQGILVTTSSFTQPARAEAKGQRVRLIDGKELERLLKP